MFRLADRPRFRLPQACEIARLTYGLRAAASPLPSERDQNFLLTCPSGEQFVLKIASASEAPAFLDAQVAALAQLQPTGLTPRLVATTGGEPITTVRDEDGRPHAVRLVTFVPGVPLAHVRRRTPRLWQDLGHALGRIDRALSTFQHPACVREFHWDLARGVDIVREHAGLLTDEEQRALVVRTAAAAEPWIAPRAPALVRAVIHNDANDHNVIVDSGGDLYERHQRVTGVIDLGDMVWSWRAGDPAVAIAYAMLSSATPLDVAGDILRGYTSVQQLEEEEIAIVFPLALLRLCMSVCIAAHQQRQAPADDYLGVSQAAIRDALPRIAGIPFRFAEARVRHACGLAPAASSARVAAWLASGVTQVEAASVLPIDPRTDPVVVLDLGPESTLVEPMASGDPEPALTARVFRHMRDAGVRLGIGRYLEPRLLYSSPVFACPGAGSEPRTVHLGLDLFAPAGTAVRAPLAGTVHAFADNRAPLDYGPVVILRHDTPAGDAFYTLYGHLSHASLDGLAVEQRLERGQRFAWLGEPEENGGWTPHLHLQIITDLLDLGVGFPGVGRPCDIAFWEHLSPDPHTLVGVSANRLVEPRAATAQLLRTRRERLLRNLSVAYRQPLHIVRGWRQYLWDDQARRFTDAYNNVPHVGHCHPRVVEAAASQMARLNTNTRYLHRNAIDLAERLTAMLPAPLRVCAFLNSASEANELALRLARAHSGARDTIVLERAYHGHTTSLIDLSPYKHAGPGGRGAPGWVHVAPVPDLYRGTHRDQDAHAVATYVAAVRAIIERLRQRGKRVGAFIAETCPSVAGQVFLPPGYLRDVYALVRRAGGVCIADEVQTGYGRLGTHFWAFEAHEVVPDIVVIGKPMGNGHPLAAVVTTPAIAASFDNGMEFFSTFGGNPVSCAVGVAVLDALRDERLQEHARVTGEHLLAGLRRLQARVGVVGDVRGSGLFLGVELVRDRETREPAGAEADYVVNRMREHGVLLGTEGPFHSVLKIRPPMPFDRDDADVLLAGLADVLGELAGS